MRHSQVANTRCHLSQVASDKGSHVSLKHHVVYFTAGRSLKTRGRKRLQPFFCMYDSLPCLTAEILIPNCGRKPRTDDTLKLSHRTTKVWLQNSSPVAKGLYLWLSDVCKLEEEKCLSIAGFYDSWYLWVIRQTPRYGPLKSGSEWLELGMVPPAPSVDTFLASRSRCFWIVCAGREDTQTHVTPLFSKVIKQWLTSLPFVLHSSPWRKAELTIRFSM